MTEELKPCPHCAGRAREEGRVTFWDDPHPLVLTGGEMRVLFSGAVRYAMHRGTLASKETAEAVRRHIRELDKGTLMVIARDIEWDTQLGGCPYFEGLPMEINEELDRRKGELCAAD